MLQHEYDYLFFCNYKNLYVGVLFVLEFQDFHSTMNEDGICVKEIVIVSNNMFAMFHLTS